MIPWHREADSSAAAQRALGGEFPDLSPKKRESNGQEIEDDMETGGLLGNLGFIRFLVSLRLVRWE